MYPKVAPALFAVILTVLAGCSQFPEVDDTVSDETQDVAYPDLVPLDSLKARLSDPRITPDMAPTLEARIARLKWRAARLRGTIIDADTRRRMRDGVQ